MARNRFGHSPGSTQSVIGPVFVRHPTKEDFERGKVLRNFNNAMTPLKKFKRNCKVSRAHRKNKITLATQPFDSES